MMNPTLITRRRLLTAMALSPLLWQMRGAQAANIDPQRVVALEWLLKPNCCWRLASRPTAWPTFPTIACG